MYLNTKNSIFRIFIDSSHRSLKVVLLHNGNKKKAIPLAYSTVHKENYETLKLLLELIKYDEFQWDFCCDLKVVNIVVGLPGGWPKYPCPYCLFDSRDRQKHFAKKCPARSSHVTCWSAEHRE